MKVKSLRICAAVAFAAFVSVGPVGAASLASTGAGVIVTLSSLVTSLNAPQMTPGAPQEVCVYAPNGDYVCWLVPAPLPEPNVPDDNGGGPGPEDGKPPNQRKDDCTYVWYDYVGYVIDDPSRCD